MTRRIKRNSIHGVGVVVLLWDQSQMENCSPILSYIVSPDVEVKGRISMLGKAASLRRCSEERRNSVNPLICW